MAVKSASTWGTNWQSGVGSAGQAYVDGIRNTTVDVAARAVAAQDRLLAGFNQAVQSGEWARRVLAVGTSGWKSSSEAKAPNYTTGATAGLPKFQRFAQQAQPIWQQASDAIAGMPRGGKANALAHVGAWYDAMQAFRQSYTP
jgi:hypothetical protein